MNALLVTIFITALTLFFSTVFRSIGWSMVFNPEALIIVCGGTIVAVFLGFPFKRLQKAVEVIISAFRPREGRSDLAVNLREIAKTYRQADIRTMEKKARSIKDDFLKLGVTLLISNQKSDAIRNVMEREMTIRIMDWNFSQNVLKTIARLTPSFGLAGTVISLIKMFRHMQSMDAMAPLMAVAMMSTFYGVIIANLFMLPLCAKLEEQSLQEEALMHSTIEGIVAVNDREHPLRVEEKINGYREIVEARQSEINGALAMTRSSAGV